MARRNVKSASGMRSPVYWTLLGLIIERPGLYAYQLVKWFRRGRDDLLPISSDSHIYTGLDVLREKGLIEAIPDTNVAGSERGRQPRPRYRATPEGERSYKDRLRAQISEDRRKTHLFARELAVFAHNPEAALEIIACLEQAFLEDASEAKAGPVDSAKSDEELGLGNELALEEKRLGAEAKLQWAAYARGKFEVLPRREPWRDGSTA